MMKYTDLQRLTRICRDGHYHGLTVLLSGSCLHAGFVVAVQFLLGKFIDSLVYGGTLPYYFLLLTGAAFAAWGTELLLKNSIIRMTRNTELQLQYRLLDALQSMKPARLDACPNGEIALKFFRDTGNISQFLSGTYPQMLNVTFSFLLAFAMVLYKQPVIAVLFVFFIPVMTIFLMFFSGKITRTTRFIRKIYDRSMNGIFEFMHIFPFLKSMDADTPYFFSPESKFRTYRKMNIRHDRLLMKLEFLNRFLLLAGEYSVLGIAGWMAWKKMIPVGDVVVFQVLFLSVLNSFSGLFQLLPNWKTTQESLHSIAELMESADTEDIDCNPPVPTALQDLSAEHISFRYPHAAQAVFKDFSCRIKAGSIVALTGLNGSGKTTLLKLLTGYLLPDHGTIRIADRDLRDWQIRSFRQKIAYVFQDSLLITGTIRDNITLKNPAYTERDIALALQLSGADTLAARMPEGLEHRIGQEGGGLSGGERQKLAIARALIRKPEILIFDEVTNHLDYPSRMKIAELTASLRGKTTVFMVSHDPELVKLCDQEINLDLY